MKQAQVRLRPQTLQRSGRVYLHQSFVSIIAQAALLFTVAGDFMIRGLVFFTVAFGCMAASALVLSKVNPEVLNARGIVRQDAKQWDYSLLGWYQLAAFFVATIVIGLDAGRFQWSHHAGGWVMAGLIMYALANVLVTWAMAVNPHFEPMVRIQRDRNHRVITSGPYRVVRHPGYVANILASLATPLAMGSLYGLIPEAAVVMLLILRTRWEDRTLQGELPGYADYAAKVRYRLLPGVW